MPGVQKPHCRPCSSKKPSCSGCSCAVLLQPLDGRRSRAPSAWTAKHRAGLDGARRRAAPCRRRSCVVSQPMCVPVRLEILADEVDQQQARLDLGLVRLAVDGQADLCARVMLLASLRALARPLRSARRSARAPWRACTRRPAQIGGRAARRRRPRAAPPRDTSPRQPLARSGTASASRGRIGVGSDVGEADAGRLARCRRRQRELRGDGRDGEVADLALDLHVGAAAAGRRARGCGSRSGPRRRRARSRTGPRRNRRSG